MNLQFQREALAKGAKLIREGKLVAFPTETVYGLGANALDPIAVARIFELKQRPAFDPLIVHVADMEMAATVADLSDTRIQRIANRLWPGPLTLILPKKEIIPDIVTSGLPTVGVRIPSNEIALELIRLSGCPIAAPSANRFGQLSPTQAEHVAKGLPGVDMIIDGGSTQVGIESTIIRLNKEGFEILRHGVITREDIESIVPFSEGKLHGNEMDISAPGMMKSHYSPDKPFYLIGETLPDTLDPSKGALISFSGKYKKDYPFVVTPSPNRDLKEYAVNIFAAMHRLQESDVEFIAAEPVPDLGIGQAIMDRLRKAAFRYISHPLG